MNGELHAQPGRALAVVVARSPETELTWRPIRIGSIETVVRRGFTGARRGFTGARRFVARLQRRDRTAIGKAAGRRPREAKDGDNLGSEQRTHNHLE